MDEHTEQSQVAAHERYGAAYLRHDTPKRNAEHRARELRRAEHEQEPAQLGLTPYETLRS